MLMLPDFIAYPHKTPDSAEIYLRADFVEFQCVIDPDKQMSRDQVVEVFRKEKDLNVNVDKEDTPEESCSKLTRVDKWTQKAEDWYELLEYRQLALQESYPFELSEDKQVLRLKKQITDAHKVYLFLLLCSRLENLRKADAIKLTSSFEFFSKKALENYLPGIVEVHLFGANPNNTSGRYSQHSIIEKITNLAADIFEQSRLQDEDKEDLIGIGGDNGLDLVGWIKFPDSQSSMLCIFAQCACTVDWVEKQNESHPKKWRNYISFTVDPLNFVFIPFYYRNTYGKWVRPKKIVDSVLIDRLRFMHLFDTHKVEIEYFPDKLIDQFLSF